MSLHILHKYNPNHGPDGRFSSGPSEVDTSNLSFAEQKDQWRAQEAAGIKPIYGALSSKPGDVFNWPKSNTGILISNALTVNHETGYKYMFVTDGFSTSLRKFNITQIMFEKLEGDTLAQCRFGWTKNDDGSSRSEAHMVFDPTKTQAMKNMWTKDQADIKAGKTPWGAVSYAKDENQFLTAVVLHEYAHGCLSDYTLKQNKSDWIDPQDPMMGTQEWKSTVTQAAKEGWKAPSVYSKQNYAEMFAECTTAIALNQTTGNRNVDAYVDKVTKK